MSVIDYTKENIKVLDTIDFSPFFKYIEKEEFDNDNLVWKK